jgi:WD40 repeat protein
MSGRTARTRARLSSRHQPGEPRGESVAADPLYHRAEPDPGYVATQQDFGRELTLARQRAGLTVRDVARAAGIPASTAGDYFSGKHLPAATQPGLLPSILRACSETDPARLEEWMSALARARRAPGRRPAAARPPYPGLASFQPEDAPWFFGRTDVTGRLVALAALDDEDSPGASAPGAAGVPLVVVGPSGSGKSSLLRAGFIPRLASRPFGLFTPTAAPLAELEAQLSRLRAGGSDSTPVIVVDQFEAIFTDCKDEEQRQAFISAVCALAGRAVVVLALRADFYDRALRYPGLARALQERQIVLGPLSREGVRSAIVEPARMERLDVEDGLVEVLLRDLAPKAAGGSPPDAAYEAGALPLLSHALLATWQRSRGGKLTLAGYQGSGGIHDAIRQTADAVYDELSDEQKDMARRLFLRLINVTDEAPAVRRVVRLTELDRSSGDVLGKFVGKRLITVDADTAQISHDALLTAWPRLEKWIADGRDNLRMRRRITDAAQAWADADRDGAALLRGGQLVLARDWAAGQDNRESLDRLAREFVDTAVAEDKIRQLAERNRTRRLHRLVAALTALVIAVFGLAGYAFQQRQAANTARAAADSREVAIEAGQVRAQSVSLAAQLSLAAYRIADTPGARASLLESSGTPAAARLIDSAGVVQAVGLSPDRGVLAVAAADGTLRLWDVARPGRPVAPGSFLAPKSGSPLYATAFSPDGRVLAAAGTAHTVSLWDVRDPRHPVRLGAPLTGPAGTVYSLAFSPGGHILAAGSADETIRLWDMTDPRAPKPLATLTGPAGYVESVAFSPDGRVLAAGSADKTVRLWNIADPAHPASSGQPLTGPASLVDAVAFSPDGKLLAAGSQDNKVWLWNVARPGHAVSAGPPLTGASDWVNAVAFSPDGTSVAAGSSDDSVLIWNVATGRLTGKLPSAQPVTSLTWDGPERLVSGDADGTVGVWMLPAPVLMAGAGVNSVAFSPGGGTLAVGSQSLQLWSAVTRRQISAVPAAGTIVNAVAFAPGGHVLAAGYGNGTMRLWRADRTLAPAGKPVTASAAGLVEFVAFSPDGKILATAGDDGTVRLWSVTDPADPLPLATVHDSGTYVFSVAFSPGGTTLAAASADNLTRLWDIADPAHPRPIGRPLGGLTSYAISAAFSPDGRTLAVGSADRTVHLWDVRHPAQPRLLGPPLTGPAGYVYSVAFSPDGRTLAAGVTDGSVWLWDLAGSGRPAMLATLTGPAGHVYSVAFSPGGRALAAGSADGTVRIWDTQPSAAGKAVCATAGQPLTRAEWATYIPGVAYQPPCPGG